ncbi:hypothetical protein AAC387_Pa02g5144 [Persea americana]
MTLPRVSLLPSRIGFLPHLSFPWNALPYKYNHASFPPPLSFLARGTGTRPCAVSFYGLKQFDLKLR